MIKFVFLTPYLEPKIWGGYKLKSFNFNLPPKPIGEAWVISAYQRKSSILKNTKYKGSTLTDFYNYHRNFFDNHLSNEYPLLVKILDCNEDLSVQVHPNIHYATIHNIPSKNEAWHILKAPDNAKIIYGHSAETKADFARKVEKNQWKKLLIHHSVHAGDLINVPAGTIHALTSGLLVLEIQESIDFTYRLYDYGRNDANRPLHIKQTIDSCNIPCTSITQNYTNELHTPFFNIHIIENSSIKHYHFKYAKWIQIVVIDGTGRIDWITKIKKGDCFIINCKKKSFILHGKLKICVSYIKI